MQDARPQEGYRAENALLHRKKYIPYSLFACSTSNPTLLAFPGLDSFPFRVLDTTWTGSDPAGLAWNRIITEPISDELAFRGISIHLQHGLTHCSNEMILDIEVPRFLRLTDGQISCRCRDTDVAILLTTHHRNAEVEQEGAEPVFERGSVVDSLCRGKLREWPQSSGPYGLLANRAAADKIAVVLERD